MRRPVVSGAFFTLAAVLLLIAPLALAAGGSRKTLNPPTNLHVTAADAHAVTLAWRESRSRNVAGYNEYRNRAYNGRTSGLTYTFSGLDCGTTYAFGVQAYSNSGGSSSIVEVTSSTTPCSAPPPPPPPPPPPKPDPCTGLVRLEGVKFDHDKSELGPNAGSILDETVTALQRCPEKRVRLDAYTDSAGSDAYNQTLSQRRADSVRAYLVQHGVAAARIDARGLGESNPVASNDTAEGRAQNRRVELQPID
jgi:outer membrane protein OmpA-like peptidoglycan-associated protein